MRPGIDSSTQDLLDTGRYDVHKRIRIANADGTLVRADHRLIRGQLTAPNPYAPVSSLSFTLLREVADDGSDSFSPLVNASLYNRLDDGVTYARFLELGRLVVMETAMTAVGGDRPDDEDSSWYEVFRGHISDIDWPKRDSHSVIVRANDLAGLLSRAKSEVAYTYEAGTPIEDVIQAVLDNNGFGEFVLNVPVATGKVLTRDYAPGLQKTVWDQVWQLAKSIGWVVWFRYQSDNTPALTLFIPERDKATSDFTVPRLVDYGQLSYNEREIGNVAYASYTNENGERRMTSAVVDEDSIEQYGGRRPFWINFAEDSPVRSEADALSVLGEAIKDTAHPDIIAAGAIPFNPFIECGVDRVTLPEDRRFFDSAQLLAPFAYTSSFEAGVEDQTDVQFRGRPSAGRKTWKTDKEAPTSYNVRPTFQELRQSFGSDSLHVDLGITVRDNLGRGGVLRAWVNKTSPESADPSAEPDALLTVSSTPMVVDASTVWDDASELLDEVRVHPGQGKDVYFEFVTDSGVSSGVHRFAIRGMGGAVDEDDDLRDGIITGLTNFGPGLTAVVVVDDVEDLDTLPAEAVVAAAGGKLYRRDSEGDWTAAVPVVDLVGEIVANTVAEGSITTAHFATGIEPLNIVTGSLPTSKTTELVFFEGKIYAWNESEDNYSEYIAAVGEVGTVNTENIANAAVTAVKIADLAVTTAKMALAAVTADILAAGAVTEAKIGSAAVTATKIGNNAVTTAKIQAGAVTNDRIADGAVGVTKLADGSLTLTKFASGITAVEIVASLPATGNFQGRTVLLTTDNKLYRYTGSGWTSAVSTSDLSGTIGSGQLASGAVTEAAIAAGAVTMTKFASTIRPPEVLSALPATGNTQGRLVFLTTDNKLYRYTGSGWTTAVPTTDLTGTIATAQIAAGAVTATQIGNAAVTTAKIATAAVTEALLANEAVTAAKLQDGAVSMVKFASGIRPPEVLSSLPSTGNVQGRQVFLTTDNKLYRYTGSGWTTAVPTVDLTGTIASGQIANGAITAVKIEDDAITAPKIATNAVTADAIAANAVTANAISANAVIAGKIAAGAVSATEIAAGAITTEKLHVGGRAVPLNNFSVTGTPDDWAVYTGSSDINTVATIQRDGVDVLAYQLRTDGNAGVRSTAFEVDPNRTYEVRISQALHPDNSSPGGTWYIGLYVYDTAMTLLTVTPFSVSSRAFGTPTNNFYFYSTSTNNVPGQWYDVVAYILASDTTDPNVVPVGTRALQHARMPPNAAFARIRFLNWLNNGTTRSRFYYSPTVAPVSSTILHGDSIQTGTLNANRIVANSITATQIAAGTITASEIATGAITAIKIVAGAITTEKIAAGAVTATTIATGAITTDKLDALTVTADKIAANAVTTAKIAAGAVTANEIAADTITAGQIAAGAISASELATNAVTAVKILAGAITADKIAANAVTADKIAANSITSGQIAAGAIGASEIAAGAITADKLLVGGSSNLIPNGDFRTGDLSGWRPWTGATGIDVVPSSTAGVPANAPNTYVARFVSATESTRSMFSHTEPYNQDNGDGIRVEPGEQYVVRVTYATSADFVGTPRVYRYYYRTTGATTSGSTSLTPSTSWQVYEETLTVPTLATKLHIYLYGASMSGTVYWGQVAVRRVMNSVLIADGAITADKLTANSVTSTAIVAGAITAAKIETGAVTTAKIAAGAVTANELAANSVTAVKILANTITGDKIAANAITANHIVAGTITAVELATGSVTAAEIATGAVTSAKIDALAVTADKIAANAVTADKIAANSVTSVKIAAGAITADKIATNSLTAGQIAAGAIGVSELAASAVNASKIAAGAITADKIAVNAVTAGKIATDAVTSAAIAANAITSDKIDVNAVTAAKILAGAITSDKIAANAVQATHIAANAITAGKLAVGFSTADALNSDPGTTDITAWEALIGTASSTISSVGTGGAVGNTALVSPTGVQSWMFDKTRIPVEHTKTYRGSAWARSASANGTFYLAINLLDADGVRITGSGTFWRYLATNVTLGTPWEQFGGNFGAGTSSPFPSNARFMQIGVLMNYGGTSGSMRAQAIRIQEVVPGVLIQDGAITASKISVSDLAAINATFSGDVKLYNDENLIEMYISDVLAGSLRPDVFGLVGIPSGTVTNVAGIQLAHISGASIGVYADGIVRSTGTFNVNGSANISDGLVVYGGTQIGIGNYTTFQVHGSDPPTDNSSITVRFNLGGTLVTRRLLIGAANSAGTGYRALRITN